MAQSSKRSLADAESFERRVVDQYTTRLLREAGRRLPERLRRRLDPEDIVQSVYRSFFWRLRDGQFTFQDSHDLWRLLAVMTYHKVLNAVKHHGRARRDARRELANASASGSNTRVREPSPGPEDVAVLFDCLEWLLKDLPEKYRQIVVFRLEGHSIADIAQRVGFSQRTVLRVLGNLQETAIREFGVAT